MATIYAATNAREVSAFFLEGSARLEAAALRAPLVIAHEAEAVVTPLLLEETPKGETGELAASQGQPSLHAVPGGAEILWSSDAPYADFVLHGTGIYHTPDPHGAWDVDGYQAFEVGGTMIHTRHTHHEGQHADDWPGRAWERSKPAIELALQAIDTRLFAVFL